MQELRYPLPVGGAANRWLLSGIREEKIRFEPVTMDGDITRWLREGLSVCENPCKTKYVAARRERQAEYAQELQPFAGGRVCWQGFESAFQVYFPFDDVNVSLSSFWFVPTCISAWAATRLIAAKAHTARFRLHTRGGVTIWLNKDKVLEACPFTRDEESVFPVDLDLCEGENRVEILFEDLAERDTGFYFRLDSLGPEPLEQAVAAGEADAEKIMAVERAFSDAGLDRNTYTQGDIVLECRNPFPDADLPLTFQGGSEENLQVGDITQVRAVLAAGGTRAVLGRSEDFPFGFMKGRLGADIGGVEVTRLLTLENYPLSHVPPAADGAEDRKKQEMEFISRYGEGNINRAAAMLYAGRGEECREEIDRIIRRQIAFINARYDCSDFYLAYFAKIWTDFSGSGLLSADLLAQMKECMLHFRYWCEDPGDDVMWFYSENHALVFHVCQLLNGELFEDEVFTNSGRTGREQAAKAKALLLDWFDLFERDGFTEWDSAPYFPIDSLGLSCLYAQTKDAQLRARAKKALDTLFYLLAVNSKDGYFACSAGRTYHKELMGNLCNATSSMNYVGYGAGNVTPAAKGVLSLCFCDYLPPREYARYLDIRQGEALRFQATQGYRAHVNLYTYKTRCYMLSAAADFHIGQPGHQEHVLQVTFDALRQIWINHPGELASHGSGRPSYWAGNGSLPRVNPYKGYASLFYRIPDEHPVGFTHLYLPRDIFDEVEQNGDWIFARAGEGFIAVYAANGLESVARGPYSRCEIRSPGRESMWIVRASDTNEFDSFASFVRAMGGAVLEADSASQTVRFADPLYGELVSGFGEALRVNGEQQVYAGYPVQGEAHLESFGQRWKEGAAHAG